MPKIEMYSPQFCPFCLVAQRLLNAKVVEFTIRCVDGNAQKRRQLMDRGGGRTVPQVFIDNRSVGGFDQLTALDMDDELDALLGLARQSPG